MLSRPSLTAAAALLAAALLAVPAAAQDFASHKAAYAVTLLDHGKPGAPIGTYAYEMKQTCSGYVITQRLRLDALQSDQQTQMTESLDGRTLHFEHRTVGGGRPTSTVKGEAILNEKGAGEAHFSQPEGKTTTLPAGTMFPMAISRATIEHAKARDGGFDALFFYGEKPKAPQSVNVLIGKVPKRLADIKIPDGAEALAKGRERIYYRGGFFDTDSKVKVDSPAFEMSSLMLDNGIELYGTHEEGDGTGIEYRITRLEALPKAECK
ncbi:MAG: DUF1849 family protein [Proteobacteria bacterium]|nr:DUF1849 family protein [Pseudomonadota bacterium]MBS0547841.1 DUF1849 family protein [Pseudomonadota bacterium]